MRVRGSPPNRPVAERCKAVSFTLKQTTLEPMPLERLNLALQIVGSIGVIGSLICRPANSAKYEGHPRAGTGEHDQLLYLRGAGADR